MNTRTFVPALPVLIVAALFTVGCGDSVAPVQRTPAGPEFWFHPPPPQLHLVLTVDAASAFDRPGCLVASDENTLFVTATVKDGANNTVTDLDGNSVALTIEHDANPGAPILPATLCGTTSAVIAGGVAPFTVGIDLPSRFPLLPPFDQYTLRGHVTGATDAISANICIGAACLT